MKDAAPVSKLHLLRSVVADARASLLQTSEAGRPSTSGSYGLEQPTHRYDLPRPAMDANASRTGEEFGIASGLSSELGRGAVPAPVTEAARQPLQPAPISASIVEAGVPQAPAPGELRATLDKEREAALAGRPLKPAFVETSWADARRRAATASDDLAGDPATVSSADVISEPVASAPDLTSTTARQVGRGAASSGHEHSSRPAGQARPAWDIVQVGVRESPTTTRPARVDGPADDRNQLPSSPGLRPAPATTKIATASPEEQRVEQPPARRNVALGAQFLGNEIAGRMQAVSRPDFAMLPNAARTDAGRLEPAPHIERVETQPEVRPVWREAASPSTWAALRAPPSDDGRNHHDVPARSPDVQIGHVDVTVISTDPLPQRPPRPTASPAPTSSLASLHYLRRF